jgi:hypothetical protein
LWAQTVSWRKAAACRTVLRTLRPSRSRQARPCLFDFTGPDVSDQQVAHGAFRSMDEDLAKPDGSSCTKHDLD